MWLFPAGPRGVAEKLQFSADVIRQLGSADWQPILHLAAPTGAVEVPPIFQFAASEFDRVAEHAAIVAVENLVAWKKITCSKYNLHAMVFQGCAISNLRGT